MPEDACSACCAKGYTLRLRLTAHWWGSQPGVLHVLWMPADARSRVWMPSSAMPVVTLPGPPCSCVDRKAVELGLAGARTDYIQTDAAINKVGCKWGAGV